MHATKVHYMISSRQGRENNDTITMHLIHPTCRIAVTWHISIEHQCWHNEDWHANVWYCSWTKSFLFSMHATEVHYMIGSRQGRENNDTITMHLIHPTCRIAVTWHISIEHQWLNPHSKGLLTKPRLEQSGMVLLSGILIFIYMLVKDWIIVIQAH